MTFDQDKEKMIGELRLVRDEIDRSIQIIDNTESIPELIESITQISSKLDKINIKK